MSDRKSWNSGLRPRSPKREADIASGKHKQKPRAGFAKLTKEQMAEKNAAKALKVVKKMIDRSLGKREPKTLKPRSESVLASLDGMLIILHSRVVRLRAMDEWGLIHCFICRARIPYEMSVAMHYQGRIGRGTRFSDIAVQAGCSSCNGKPNGDRKNFARKLNEKYGEGTSSRMDILSKQVMHYDRMWYCTRIGELKNEEEELKR